MLFSIIYEFDVPYTESVKPYQPSQLSLLFVPQETDAYYKYSHLGGIWKKGKHRKYAALLNRKQFEQFLNDTGLYYETDQTMRMMGVFVPDNQVDYGIMPAIAFRADHDYCIASCYVYPLPQVVNKNSFNERDWKRVIALIKNIYS
jgi:hypothetical protein